jgi:hypothetical protein
MSLGRYWIAQCTNCGEDSAQIDGHGTKKETQEMLTALGWYISHREAYCPECVDEYQHDTPKEPRP